MAVKLTLKRYLADSIKFSNQLKTDDLFGQDFSIVRRVNKLIDELDKNNKIEEFCSIVYDLQNTTKGYCLDKYKFYLEYQKQSLEENRDSTQHFTKADAEKMFTMCKKFKFSTLCIIGFMLLYRDYEPNSIFVFFTENPQEDTTPEAIEALAQEDEINKQAEAQIQRDKAIIYSEKERKNNPPLKDSTVRDRISYSPYSRWNLNFAVKALQNKDKNYKSPKYQSFIRILYTLQYKKRDLNIFDKEKFNQFIKTYWCKFYTEGEFCVRFYGSDISHNINECKLKLQYLNSNEYNLINQNGGLWYRKQLEFYTSALEQYRHYNYYDEECSDIIPNEDECDILWDAYTHSEDTLVYSIAILIHEKGSEWKRVLNYYLTSGEHVMIAKNPVLGKEDNNSYIVHPKLKRPIEKTIVNKSSNRPKYKNKSATDIIANWVNGQRAKGARFAFILIIFLLQTEGAKIIEETAFKETFSKQIETYKISNNAEILSFDTEMDIESIMINCIEDKKELLHDIAMLIDVGYFYKDIYPYYKSLLIASPEQS